LTAESEKISILYMFFHERRNAAGKFLAGVSSFLGVKK